MPVAFGPSSHGTPKRNPATEGRKERPPGPGTSLPFILAFTPPPKYLLVPPPTSHSRSGAQVTVPTAGKQVGLPSLPLPLARKRPSSQTTCFIPCPPIPPQDAHSTTKARSSKSSSLRNHPSLALPYQSLDPHKHLFDLGVLAPPLRSLESLHQSRTHRSARPRPQPTPKAGGRVLDLHLTWSSPAAALPPTSPAPPSPRREKGRAASQRRRGWVRVPAARG